MSDSWILTYSGAEFDLLEPDPKDVRIFDIAHALANCCRFGGHTQSFYSVADHSVSVSNLVPAAFALDGLLHDAAEAYVHDITRPLKRVLSDTYANIEQSIHHVIADRYGIAYFMPHAVKVADNVMLATEGRDLMTNNPWWNHLGYEPLQTTLVGSSLSPTDAEAAFLKRFAELTGQAVSSLTASS